MRKSLLGFALLLAVAGGTAPAKWDQAAAAAFVAVAQAWVKVGEVAIADGPPPASDSLKEADLLVEWSKRLRSMDEVLGKAAKEHASDPAWLLATAAYSAERARLELRFASMMLATQGANADQVADGRRQSEALKSTSTDAMRLALQVAKDRTP